MKAVCIAQVVVTASLWLCASPAEAQNAASASADVQAPVAPAKPAEAPAAPGPVDVPVPLKPVEAVEKKLLEWSMFDFQYLYGFNWDLGPKRKDILTLEHADGWKLGDNYLFVDVMHLTNQDAPTGFYGEWQPRLSLSKIFGLNLNTGLLHDILETNRLAFGDGFLAYLVGAAVDLNVPGFAYWHQHFFVRSDTQLGGSTWQVTTEWAVPIEIGPVRFVQDGFVHFIGAEGKSSLNIITQPQLLLDVGNFAGYKDQLFVGAEVDLRYNEYGIKGQNEAVPQAMVEWKL